MNINSKENKKNAEVSYKTSKKLKAALPLVGFMMLLIGFGANFDLENSIKSIINKSLNRTGRCKINVGIAKLEIYTLGLNLSDIQFKGSCPQSVKLIESAYAGFRGFSFSPIGINLKTEINIKDLKRSPVASLALGISSYKIVLDNQSMELNKILKLTNLPISLNGVLITNGFIEGSFKKVIDGKIEVSISKLTLPEQEIQGLVLPEIELNTNTINLHLMKDNTLMINSISLGQKGDTAQILAQGKIKNILPINKASLNIEGKFDFQKTLNQKIPLLGLLLSGKKKKQGFYQFELKGRTGKPNFKIK